MNYAHDFALFEHHYVFHITPFVKVTQAKVLEIASGLSSPGEQMRYYHDLPCRMVVIPRDCARCTEYRFFDLESPCHIFHFATARSTYKPRAAAGTPIGGAESATMFAPGTAAGDVDSLELSAVCLPTKFAMFPTEHGAFLSNASTAPGKLCHFRLRFGQERTPVRHRILEESSCEFPATHPYRNGLPSRYTSVSTVRIAVAQAHSAR